MVQSLLFKPICLWTAFIYFLVFFVCVEDFSLRRTFKGIVHQLGKGVTKIRITSC